jgi:ABC-type sugar transport system ATPase subunit
LEPLIEKVETGKKCIEKVKDKPIILLIGGSGCGKSLAIQFLAGS